MAFKGTLKEFKVPDILQLIAMQKKTGILTFNSHDGFVTIIFEDGLIVGIDAFPKKLEMRLGTVLVKQEIISEEMLHRALSIQKRTGQKVGEILISMGLINEESISQALRTQAFQIIFSLFNWKKGEYNFKVMEVLDNNLKVLKPISADNLIMEGVQMLDEWPLIKKVIPSEEIVFEPAPLGNRRIEVISEPQDDVEHPDPGVLYMVESEVNLLKHVNGKNSVKDLAEMGFFTEYRVYKSLYNLFNKGLIQKKSKIALFTIPEMESRLDKAEAHPETVRNLFRIFLILVLLFMALNIFAPFKPFKRSSILLDAETEERIFKQEQVKRQR